MKLKDKYEKCLGMLFLYPNKRWDEEKNAYITRQIIVMPIKLLKEGGWYRFTAQVIEKWNEGDKSDHGRHASWYCKEFLKRAMPYRDEIISQPAAPSK